MIQDLSGYLFASKFYEACCAWPLDVMTSSAGQVGANGRVRVWAKATYDLRKWFYEKMSPFFGPTDGPILDFWGNMDHPSSLGVSRSYIVHIQTKSRTCFDVFLDRNFKGLLNVRNEKHSIWYKSYICSGRGWKEKIVLHLTTLNLAFYFWQNYIFWWTIRLIWSMEKLQSSSEWNLN